MKSGRIPPVGGDTSTPDKCHNVGKSKGFRLVYDWNPATRVLWLLRLFTHAQMSDLVDREIRKIRNEAEID